MPGTIQSIALTNEKVTVGVFNEKGVCSGIINIDNPTGAGTTVLVAFGTDAQSPGQSGFTDGENMVFRLHVKNSQQTYNLQLTFDESFPDNDMFKANGMSGISGVEITGVVEGIPTKNGIFIYPNPGNGIFYVDLSAFTQPCQIEVFNARGEILRPVLYETGKITTIDLSGKVKGIYLVKFVSGQFSSTKKVVLR